MINYTFFLYSYLTYLFIYLFIYPSYSTFTLHLHMFLIMYLTHVMYCLVSVGTEVLSIMLVKAPSFKS